MKKIGVIIIVLLLGTGGYFLLKNCYPTPAPGPAQQELPTEKQIPPEEKSLLPTQEERISIKNFAFNPSTLTIRVGTTVIWTNEDSAPHNIKSDTFNSEILNKGSSYKFQFNNAGNFDYICGIHPSMKGKIIVENKVMFREISYFPILGKPLILYLGILVLISFLSTASIAVLNRRGIHKIPLVWHFRMAKLSLGLAIIHGSLALLAYFS